MSEEEIKRSNREMYFHFHFYDHPIGYFVHSTTALVALNAVIRPSREIFVTFSIVVCMIFMGFLFFVLNR